MSEALKDLTSETIERSIELDDRAEIAKESTSVMEKLIDDFKVFLQNRVYRYSSRANDTQREEMFGTAMLAFYEAVQKYDASKGHFFPFVNRVVCERLIDFNRKAFRSEGYTVSLEEVNDEQAAAQSTAIAEVSLQAYEAKSSHEKLVDEIEQFKVELSLWGLTMSSLVDQSPKHSRLREEYKMVIAKIIETPDIIQTIQLKRYFPIKAIAKISGLPQKKLERARSFILASLIIRMGDYSYLSEYVNDRR